MVAKILDSIHNYFIHDVFKGHYTIAAGRILDFDALRSGQYFKIEGSVMNDGVHKYDDQNDVLHDETFDGTIYCLAVPKQLLNLADEISAWVAKYGNSPYISESFAGYSYAKGASGRSNASVGASWEDVFRTELNAWRKIS